MPLTRNEVTPYTSDERLYLDRDGKVVGEDSPDRQTLLVGAGGTLSAEKAKQYGLVPDDRSGAEQEEPVARQTLGDDPTGEKATRSRAVAGAAPQTKAVTRSDAGVEDKSVAGPRDKEAAPKDAASRDVAPAPSATTVPVAAKDKGQAGK